MQKETEPDLSLLELLHLIEKAPIGILYFNSKWKIKYINENLYSFGIFDKNEESSLVGKNLLETISLINLKIKDELVDLPNGVFFEKEIRNVKTADSSEISLIIKGASLNKNNKFSGGILILEDIRVSSDAKQENLYRNDAFEKALKEYCDFFFITDSNFIIKYSSLNDLGKRLFIEKEITNNNIIDLFKSAAITNTEEAIEKFKSNNQLVVNNLSCENGNNTLTFQMRILPFKPSKKTTQLFFILVKDISLDIVLKKAHKEELDELKRYQVITSTVSDGLIGLDFNGNITFWNKSAEELFELSRSEVYGKFIGKVIKTFNKKYFDSLITEIETGKIWKSEIKVIGKRGQEIYIAIKMSMMKEEDFNSIIILCSNVTERIQIEKELRTSEERFRNIVLNANEFICNLTLEGNLLFTNPSFIKMFEYDESEFHQKNFKDLLDPSFEGLNKFNLQAYLLPQTKPVELPCISKSGKKFFILANFSPIFDYNNQLKYFNGIFTDITEKKEVERHLLTIRSVYEASRDGISVEVGRKISLVNDSFAKIFGYENAEELIGKNPLELVAEIDKRRIETYIELREGKEEAPTSFEFLGKRKDGSNFFIETSVTTYESESNIYIVSVCRDVTERKRAQEAVRDSEEKYRSIAENIDAFIWTAARIGDRLRTVFYTSGIEKITGYAQEQFIRDSKLWFKIILPSDSEFVKNKLKLLLNDTAHTSDEIEHRIVNRIGNIVWIRNKININRDKDGKPFKIYGLVSDITLSKKAEEDLKKSAEQLKELNDAKDKFISIISHDLRTPFSSILGFTELLLGDKEITSEQRNYYISLIQESSKNMLALVNSLLDWTRLQTGRMKVEPERINVKITIDNAISIVQGSALKKGILLQSSLKENLFIHADHELLLQVFNNLLSNAIKFTRKDGEVTISAEPELNQNQVHFIVKDNGIGILKDDLSKLFKVETKFTTNGTAGERGSGLGLSLVYEIVEKHGGKIWVESEYGHGSEFHITLPFAAVNVLLVDDNKTDRLLYTKILKNMIPNYKIDVASNGKEAFAMILQSSPALLITDHNMPEMSGYDLVKKIIVSDIKGKPPVIVLSGDINKNITDEYRELGVEFIFQKPVNLSSLRTAIEKSLKKVLLS
jgi:PAS domain S-box-containing protein